MKSLGIPNKLVRFFWLIFLLNISFTLLNQWNKESSNALNWLLNLLFPVWAPWVIAFPVGLLFAFIPYREFGMEKRFLRGLAFGAIVITFLFFIFYFYELLINSMTK